MNRRMVSNMSKNEMQNDCQRKDTISPHRRCTIDSLILDCYDTYNNVYERMKQTSSSESLQI